MSTNNTIKPSALIFVYGSLTRGNNNKFAKLLYRCGEYIGVAHIKHVNPFTIADYPAAKQHKKAAGRIVGQLYRLKYPHLTLPRLDKYEEVGQSFPTKNDYKRTEQLVYTSNTAQYAWVYTYNKAGAAVKEHKTYAAYMKRKQRQEKRKASEAWKANRSNLLIT